MPQPTFKVKMNKEESDAANKMMEDMLVAARGLGGFIPEAEPVFQKTRITFTHHCNSRYVLDFAVYELAPSFLATTRANNSCKLAVENKNMDAS